MNNKNKPLYEHSTCEYTWEQIKTFFLKKDDDGNYKHYPVFDVLKKLQQLFAAIRLSPELMGYLREIIDNDTEKHEDLVARMSFYLPDLLRHGFLFEFKHSEENEDIPAYTPDQQALNCFHGFWVIYGQLNYHKVNIDAYFDSSWQSFEEQFLKNTDKATLDQAYRSYAEKAIKDLGKCKGQLARSNEGSIINRIKKDADHFSKYLLKENNSKTDSKIIQHQIWIRRYFHLKDASDAHSIKINSSKKEKVHLAKFLRLISVAQFPMELNYAYLDITKSDLQVFLGPKINISGTDISDADLRNADLRDANLRYADLRNIDLSNANLRNADLRYTDLRNADFSNADLRNADLRYANLRSANLRDADLSKTDFSYANLSYAKLSKADLSYANLSHADIRHAHLHHAYLHNADIRNADLSHANLCQADLSQVDIRNADFSDISLINAKIANKNWIQELSNQNVIRAESVVKNYIIEEELSTFTDKWRGEYEAYLIKRIED